MPSTDMHELLLQVSVCCTAQSLPQLATATPVAHQHGSVCRYTIWSTRPHSRRDALGELSLCLHHIWSGSDCGTQHRIHLTRCL